MREEDNKVRFNDNNIYIYIYIHIYKEKKNELHTKLIFYYINVLSQNSPIPFSATWWN